MAGGQKPGSLGTLISELTSHHFCHIRFLQDESPGPVGIQAGDSHKGMATRGQDQWSHHTGSLPVRLGFPARWTA